MRLILVFHRIATRRSKIWLSLAAIFLLLFVFSSAYQFPSLQTLSSGVNQSQGGQYHFLAPGNQSSLSIILQAEPSAHYSFFNLNIRESVVVTANATSLSLSNNTKVSIVTSFQPSSIEVFDTLSNGSRVSIPAKIQKGIFASSIGIQFTIPALSQNFTFTIRGEQTAENVLYRQVAYIPVMSVNGLPNVTTSSTTLVVVPYHSIIANAYTYGGPGGPGGFPFSLTEVGTTKTGDTIFSVPTIGATNGLNTFVMQSVYYYPVSIALFVVAIAVVLLAILGLVPSITRRFTSLFSGLSRSVILPISSAISSLERKWSSIGGRRGTSSSGQRFSTKRFFKKYVQSKNLLILFILTGVLMASLAAAVGSAPQFKVYVVADPATATAIQNNLQPLIGNVEIITPAQDYVDFQVMSSVGTFNMMVVSNYTSFNIDSITSSLAPGITNVPVIVVDNASNPTLAALVRSAHPKLLLNVTNAANLNATEQQALKNLANCCARSAPNILGLKVSNNDFAAVAATEGALSLIIVYLGWAFIAAKAVEPTSENTLTHMVLIVALGIFVFFFSEMTYVVTSTIMRFPVSLHAVISGATDITATSLLGTYIHAPFGGGSTPRDLAAVLGIFVGALGNGWETQFSKKSLAFFIGLALIFYFNPFTIGQFTFQFFLLFAGNVYLGPITSNVYSFKHFLYGIGSAFGGSTTPVYLLSAGKIAYFAGLVPLAFIKRMGKSTATLTLIAAAIILGHGGLRVGEMTPDKTIIAVMPGLAAGLVFGFVFLLIAALEQYLASHYRKGEQV